MFPHNLTRAEARARAALIQTDRYQVTVDLRGRDLDRPTESFRSTSTVEFTARAAGALHVDLIADAVEAADLDGTPLDPTTFTGSRMPLEVTSGPHTLTVSARCRYSRSGEGLHRFVDPRDNRIYLYTQFETADARRVYACFEQPDLKARFRIAVIAPQSWTVVSNGPEVQVSPVAPDQHQTPYARWDFAETARVSTYLTAVVAGEYTQIRCPEDQGPPDVPMSVLCRQSLAGHLEADRLSPPPPPASGCTKTISAWPTRSVSTTRCSCRSTTRARWRTSAAW